VFLSFNHQTDEQHERQFVPQFVPSSEAYPGTDTPKSISNPKPPIMYFSSIKEDEEAQEIK